VTEKTISAGAVGYFDQLSSVSRLEGFWYWRPWHVRKCRPRAAKTVQAHANIAIAAQRGGPLRSATIIARNPSLPSELNRRNQENENSVPRYQRRRVGLA
jgi:hypothetical protein